MAQLPTSPKQSEFQKVSAEVLQYIFDLETTVEHTFHAGTLVSWCILSGALGFVLAIVL